MMLLGAAFAVCSIAAAATVFTSAAARADATTYLNDMHEAGITSADGDADLLIGGRTICKELASGKSRQQVAAEVVYESDKNQGGKGIDPKEADQAVLYANDDLCPDA